MGVKIADFDYVGFSGSRHGAPPAIVEAARTKCLKARLFALVVPLG
jgi:hypothetical protein